MPSRRQLLGTLAAAAGSAVAGCNGCARHDDLVGLRPELRRVERDGDRWQFEIDVEVTLRDRGANPVAPGLELAAFAIDRTLLDAVPVGDVRTDDVPTADREESDCGATGTVTRGGTLAVEGPPAYLAARLRGLDRLDPGTVLELQGLRHKVAPAVPTGGDGGGTTPRSVPSASATRERTTSRTTTGGWAPPRLSRAQYERVDVESPPWPPLDERALGATPGLSDVAFRAGARCHPERDREPRATVDPWEHPWADLELEWLRPIPRGSCLRPLLTDASLEGEEVRVAVGLHEAPSVPCSSCRYLRYRAFVGLRRRSPRDLDEAVITHVDSDGALLERVRTTV